MNKAVLQSGYSKTMLTMTLNEIKEVTEAHLNNNVSGHTGCIRGINTDSRTVKPGELFVALKGENFDAHDFILHAKNRGASAYLIDHDINSFKPSIVVQDTRIAFGQIASAWRDKFNYPVVAVTGSNGKTTVKEMLNSIFNVQGSVLATQGNFNNDIGVPITLCRMTNEHDTAVIEMGANHQKEISYLTQLVKPDVAIITNASAAHLEGFGSIEGVAKAKGEIFEGLPESGIAILNMDDAQYGYWKKLVQNKKVITFGENKQADVRYTLKTKGDLQIEINHSKAFQLNLPLLGKHNINNALAAIAAAIALDVDYQAIKEGLESIKAVPGRLEKKQGIKNTIIIDDTYNANPASLAAAVNAIQALQFQSHMVLGDMGELGEQTDILHKESAEVIAKANFKYVYTLGANSKSTYDYLVDKNIPVQHFATHQELFSQLEKNISPNDLVLVKGSRSMHMENIVNALCDLANEVKS